MTEEACVPSEVKPKRKSPRRALQLRAKILELIKVHKKTPVEICKILHKTKQAIYPHIENLIADGELKPEESTYVRAGPPEERKWYKIVERVNEELDWYKKQGLYPPTLRKMYYRLIELGVLAKDNWNYDRLSRKTAEARRGGVDSTFTKEVELPTLPIDCFRDEGRITIGETDIGNEPSDPESPEDPEDPEEYIDSVIQTLKDAPDDYDGSVGEGTEENLLKFQEDRNVRIVSTKGFSSLSYLHENCERLKSIAATHDHVENIIILYFGDYDKAGEDIATNLENALEFFGVQNFEFRRVAITEEQIKKYKLIENPEKQHNVQLEAFLTTDERLAVFKKLVLDAIDDCWNEDIYDENCPQTLQELENELAEKGEWPEEIDPDNDFYDQDSEETIREMMYRKITEAFKPGWQNEQ